MALSASQIEQFESDGYLVVEQYYSPEEVDKLKKEMAWILEGSMDQASRKQAKLQPLHF